MPPVANNPAAEGIQVRVLAGRAVELQASGVDEETLTNATARRAAISSVNASRLPAGVRSVGLGQVEAVGEPGSEVELLDVVGSAGSGGVGGVESAHDAGGGVPIKGGVAEAGAGVVGVEVEVVVEALVTLVGLDFGPETVFSGLVGGGGEGR